MGLRDARPLWAFGAIALVAMAAGGCISEPPEVGVLDAVYVPPAERVEIYSLGRGQTFGGLLNRTVSANEQAELLLAFQEHADPRRMRERTEITLRYLKGQKDLRGVDVAISPDETVRLDRDLLGWSSDLIRTPVYIDTLFASGRSRPCSGARWSTTRCS